MTLTQHHWPLGVDCIFRVAGGVQRLVTSSPVEAAHKAIAPLVDGPSCAIEQLSVNHHVHTTPSVQLHSAMLRVSLRPSV